MEPARHFEDLIVWQKAHQVVILVYRLTENFPAQEIYGLAAQFRRAVVSIPANIAEGFKRTSLPEKLRFLNIAQGSLEECRYYSILSKDLGYGEIPEIPLMLDEVSKLLHRYCVTLRAKLKKSYSD